MHGSCKQYTRAGLDPSETRSEFNQDLPRPAGVTLQFSVMIGLRDMWPTPLHGHVAEVAFFDATQAVPLGEGVARGRALAALGSLQYYTYIPGSRLDPTFERLYLEPTVTSTRVGQEGAASTNAQLSSDNSPGVFGAKVSPAYTHFFNIKCGISDGHNERVAHRSRLSTRRRH